MDIDPETNYSRATDRLLQRSTAGLTVLLRDDWERPVSLDPLSHLVWTCLAFGGSAIDIAADIETVVPPRQPEETATEPLVLLQLVVNSLEQLADLGLLRVTPQ